MIGQRTLPEMAKELNITLPKNGFLLPGKLRSICENSDDTIFRLFVAYVSDYSESVEKKSVVAYLRPNYDKMSAGDKSAYTKKLSQFRGSYDRFTVWVTEEYGRILAGQSGELAFRMQAKRARRFLEIESRAKAFLGALSQNIEIGRIAHEQALATRDGVVAYMSATKSLKAYEQAPTNLNPFLGQVKIEWFSAGKSELLGVLGESVVAVNSAVLDYGEELKYCEESREEAQGRIDRKDDLEGVEGVVYAAFERLKASADQLRDAMQRMFKDLENLAEGFASWAKTHALHNWQKQYEEDNEVANSWKEVRDAGLNIGLLIGGMAVVGLTGGLGILIYAPCAFAVKKSVVVYDNAVMRRARNQASALTVEERIKQAQIGSVKSRRRHRFEKGRDVALVTLKVADYGLQLTSELSDFVGVPAAVFDSAETATDTLIGAIENAEIGNKQEATWSQQGEAAATVMIAGGDIPSRERGQWSEADQAEAAWNAVADQWFDKPNDALLDQFDEDRTHTVLASEKPMFNPPQKAGGFRVENGWYVWSAWISLDVHDTHQQPVYLVDLYCSLDGASDAWYFTKDPIWETSVWCRPSTCESWNEATMNAIDRIDEDIRYLLWYYDKNERSGQLAKEIGVISDSIKNFKLETVTDELLKTALQDVQ